MSIEKTNPDIGTQLAVQRTYLADERTLMAWIRTSLSMISFGFTLGKLGEVLQDVQFKGLLRVRTVSIKELAYFLVVIGTLALVGASVQYWRRVHELRSLGLQKHVSFAFAVALLLVAVGGFVIASMVASA